MDREAEAVAATEVLLEITFVLLEITFAGFDGLRAECFEADLELLLEPGRAAAFACLAFKRNDLGAGGARREAFFAALGFVFALVAIRAGTYKGYAS